MKITCTDLVYVFILLFLNTSCVQAVFSDDAFITDWQLANLGPWEKVIPDSRDRNRVLILSNPTETSCLVSSFNVSSGQILFRNVLPFTIDEIQLDSNDHNAMVCVNSSSNHWQKFDLHDWFLLEEGVDNAPSTTILPQSSYLNDQVSIKNNELHILDEQSKLAEWKLELPQGFNKVEYFHREDPLALVLNVNDTQYMGFSANGTELIPVWQRDEWLTNVVDYAVLDVFDSRDVELNKDMKAELDSNSLWNAYWLRLTTNWNRLINLLKENQFSPGRVFTKLLALDAKDTTVSDLKFGFAKILIVLTHDGFIGGLDMVNKGQLIWELDLEIDQGVKMFWTDKNHDELVVFSHDGHYLTIEVTKDQPIIKSRSPLSERKTVDSVIRLNEHDHQYLIKFEDKDHLLFKLNPGKNTDVPIVANNHSSSHIFVTEHDTNGIYGYIIENDTVKQTWKKAVNSKEKMVAYSKRETTNLNTLGITLGDKSVLYKYLYPNLAAYLIANEEHHTITFNLIDTITGEILITQEHKDSPDFRFPMDIVFGEYWVVYSYFSSEPVPEQKLVVVELYESLTPDERLSNSSDNFFYDPLTGHINKPQFQTKQFIFPEIIKTMSISKTTDDITTKAIVMELENGQITYIPKLLLNARGKPAEEMAKDKKKEFMATPYTPVIPINDNFIITHFRNLLPGSDSQLISIPTNLESTSIICDLGLDVFCTRITPSGQFDLMSPTFEKGKLLITIFVLLVITYFIRPSVSNKKLKSQWLIK
ncbi:EC1118_1C17_0232p [Saccharomyces cerevisiae EC1118]|uniref:ER membrane protein complex subunit 1 n=1 Tax=Saccharomyces cerevisiae (strain Lalvin EC1118 / Prise de mousse) TaxID=643680 RepID=C8Z444_YEAS8|nr:EC1118_1C17_0232p [Saccharomyces cerevisiae EC1118]